jgi:hypothetical protein
MMSFFHNGILGSQLPGESSGGTAEDSRQGERQASGDDQAHQEKGERCAPDKIQQDKASPG